MSKEFSEEQEGLAASASPEIAHGLLDENLQPA
jgi:hypothetical protein